MIEKYDNGDWEEFELVNGIKQGKATYHYKNGTKEEYCYLNGKKQGKSILYSKEEREERNYIDGILQGKVTFHKKSSIEETTYINGILQGKSTIWYYKTKEREERNYVNGVLQGISVIWYHKTKEREERNYVDGIVQGRAIHYYSDGIKKEYTYINGIVQGKSTYNLKEYNNLNKKDYTHSTIKEIAKNNEIENISKHFHKNGKLKSKITDYKKIMNIKKINPYFDEKYADEIKRVYEIHDINGVIESVTGYSGFDDTDFKSQEIIYNAGKIDCVKTYFKNKIKKDYYENEKLKRTVLRKEIKGEWEDYKTIYYDENGNKKETVYEIEEEEEFFGRIFSRLGASLSEKIKETDVKETLININNTLEKYKK